MLNVVASRRSSIRISAERSGAACAIGTAIDTDVSPDSNLVARPVLRFRHLRTRFSSVQQSHAFVLAKDRFGACARCLKAAADELLAYSGQVEQSTQSLVTLYGKRSRHLVARQEPIFTPQILPSIPSPKSSSQNTHSQATRPPPHPTLQSCARKSNQQHLNRDWTPCSPPSQRLASTHHSQRR